ncbi:hypothetical protein PGTUg99_015627 [Puccinia graminis f. sp. tritici]|uniref:Uncharacterized protein n=1 Tax=Puccinia graminis f. sp. tritici TaxID=56615 RepID=A0A5B0RV89_PUCGR|nr:hypothetical protein PGTUg99_015627 [Puccinia graminis f. sp. tritici]
MMSQLTEKPKATATLQSQQLPHQADLVIQGFRRLIAEYDLSGSAGNTTDISLDHPLRSKEDILAELGSSLLPLLKQQITSLSQALDNPDQLRQDLGPTLQLILELQPKLAQTLYRIIRAIDHLVPPEGPESSPTIDQHMKELKHYRLRRLDTSIRVHLRAEIRHFFLASCRIIEAIKLPTQQRSTPIGYLLFGISDPIDRAVRWIEASEFLLLQNWWLRALGDIEDAVEDLLVVANPTDRHIRGPLPQLAQSSLPLLKLIRLFFNKFFDLGLAKEELVKSYTDMSTEQLLSFEKFAQDIAEAVLGLVCGLQEEEDEVVDQAQISLDFMHRVKSLSPLFQSLLLLSNLYIIPLFPDSDLSPSQISFKPWLVTWYTLFFQATNNAIKTANLLSQDLD